MNTFTFFKLETVTKTNSIGYELCECTHEEDKGSKTKNGLECEQRTI